MLFNKKDFMHLFILLLSILILYFFTAGLKIIHSALIFVSILFSSAIYIILYIFKKLPKNQLKSLATFLFMASLIIIPLTIWNSIPIETKGVNSNNLKVRFDFFIVNEEISQEDLLDYIEGSNTIWNKYNISILNKGIRSVNIDLSDEERTFLYKNISSKDNSKESCEIYMSLINKITNNNSNLSIIFVEGEGNSGRGSLCGHSFAIFDYEKSDILGFNLKDLTSWNLAHEIGHVLGLTHPTNIYKLNLMNDKHKIFYKSSFLTQDQIDKVVNKIDEFD